MLFVARNKNCELTFKERIENSPLSAYHEAMRVVARNKNCALIFKERIENSPFKSLRRPYVHERTSNLFISRLEENGKEMYPN